MKALYGKFHQANTMLGTIRNDVSSIINQRLTDRQNILNDIDNNINNTIIKELPTKPLSYTNTMDYDLLENSKFFKERNYPFNTVSKNVEESFENPTDTTINTAIIFLGTYKQTKGQFINLDDVKLNLSVNEITVQKGDDIIAVLSVTNILGSKQYPNTIEIALESLEVKTDVESWLPVQNIFKTLGIITPCILYLTMDKYKSSENIEHTSYRLFNDSHDTIMYLQKID